MKIAILLYDNFTALDAIGPYEVLSRIPDSEICLTGLEPGLYKDLNGLRVYAEYSIVDMPRPEILLVPGGFGIDNILDNTMILDWIINVHETTLWTTSVCSGALLLGAAGLLKDIKATTHWSRREQLKQYCAEVVDERYVKEGKIITSAGVSAGIDMALYLTSLVLNENSAKMIQLSLEYDPQPPFDCGTLKKAPAELIELMKRKVK